MVFYLKNLNKKCNKIRLNKIKKYGNIKNE